MVARTKKWVKNTALVDCMLKKNYEALSLQFSKNLLEHVFHSKDWLKP